MSSGAIMAIIEEKEEELEKLTETKISVNKIRETMDCVTSKYVQAGKYIKNAGDIGGVPFDNGKTEKKGIELKKITTETEEIIVDIEKRIVELELEIQMLYQEYDKARIMEEVAAKKKTSKKRK